MKFWLSDNRRSKNSKQRCKTRPLIYKERPRRGSVRTRISRSNSELSSTLSRIWSRAKTRHSTIFSQETRNTQMNWLSTLRYAIS